MNGELKLILGRRKLKIFLILLLFANLSYSQSIVKGRILETNSQNAINASVTLKDSTGDILAYTYSNENGFYELKSESSGSLILTVNSLGFEEKKIEVNFHSDKEVKEINVSLSPKYTEIKEVFIENKSIRVKNDTITFNAKSFLQGNEEVVEDLLKKIPGLNIDKNGTIKVGNQEVEKVMIEGDDLFDKGYKILTKNMPVNPIDKIELYQNYSNNKHLKGIENSNKVALNLKLKEDFKHVWFGNALLGNSLVSGQKYEMKLNFINFGKKNKYYILSNLNNIGLDVTGDINHLIRPMHSDEPGNIGDDQSVNTTNFLNFETPNLDKKRNTFNNAELLSLNSIFSLSKKTKLKTLAFLNTDENDFFKNSFQSFNVGVASFQNSENLIGRKKLLTTFGRIELNYDVSENKTLTYISKINLSTDNSKSDLLFNGETLNEKLISCNTLFDQKVNFTNKFSENKAFVVSGRLISEKMPQDYLVNQIVSGDLFNQNANNTKQINQNHMTFGGIEAHFLNKRNNEDLFELKLGNKLRIDKLDTSFGLYNNENLVSLPPDYQNSLSYRSNDLYLSGKYMLKIKDISISSQADIHQIFNQLKDKTQNFKNNTFFIPKLSFEWDINEKNKIISSYSHNTTNLSVIDIYPGYIQSGFRSFLKGLGDFDQLQSTSAFFNYACGNWGEKFFANTYIIFSKNIDFISTNTTVSQNYSLIEKILVKDREFLSGYSTIDYYFKPVKANFKFTVGATKSNFKNSINNSELRNVKSNTLDYGIEIRSSLSGAFNYHFGTKWNYYQIKTDTESSYANNTNFIDLSFQISKSISLQLKSERYYFGNLEKNNNQYYFLDFEGKYIILENKLNLFLTGNNIFNTQKFRNYSITDLYVSKTEYRLQPRFIMLKMEYRF